MSHHHITRERRMENLLGREICPKQKSQYMRIFEQYLHSYKHRTTVSQHFPLSIHPQVTPWRLSYTSCAGHVRTGADTHTTSAPVPATSRSEQVVGASSPQGPSHSAVPHGDGWGVGSEV